MSNANKEALDEIYLIWATYNEENLLNQKVENGLITQEEADKETILQMKNSMPKKRQRKKHLTRQKYQITGKHWNDTGYG